MENERDPRIDPKPRDVIRKVRDGAKALDRCVTGRKGNDVYYVAKSHNAGRIKNCWITTWQDWAKGTIITAKRREDTAYDRMASSPG